MMRTVLFAFVGALAIGGGLVALVSVGRTLLALERAGAYRVSPDLAYGTLSRQRLDVYTPTIPAAGGHPVVVFFYGGSWNRGSRQDYAFVGAALASRGVVAVVADYRLYPEVRYPAFLQDCAAAVAWAQREIGHYGGDPSRLFVAGYSAGAYNAAMLALDQRWLAGAGLAPAALAGWVGIAGPYDFLPIHNPDVQPVFFHPATPPDTQPLAHASAAAPPSLLLAASRDSLVDPERNTAQLGRKLAALGVPVAVKRYPWVNHYTLIATFARPLRWAAPLLDDVVRFVKSPLPRPPGA